MKKVLKIGLVLLLALSLVACGNNAKTEKHELQIGATDHAAHGTRGFAYATVVLEGDTIVLAYLDEYQVVSTESYKGVPNSENFVDYFEDPLNAFGSKRVNDEAYSAAMTEKGNATVTIAENFNAIQKFVVGKTVKELKEVVEGTPEAAIDAVTGATLVDTQGYLNAILLAAEATANNPKVTYEGKLDKLTIGQVDNAPHGTKAFAITTAVTDGTNVVLAYFDEFQFLAAGTNKGVANSENYAIVADYVLASKRVNAEGYSKNMAEKGGATVTIDANFDAILAHVANKSIADLEALVKLAPGEIMDAVSGATLVDISGYITGVIEAAKNSK